MDPSFKVSLFVCRFNFDVWEYSELLKGQPTFTG